MLQLTVTVDNLVLISVKKVKTFIIFIGKKIYIFLDEIMLKHEPDHNKIKFDVLRSQSVVKRKIAESRATLDT